VAEHRPWRAVDPDLFRFTSTELAPLHIAVMAAFEQSAADYLAAPGGVDRDRDQVKAPVPETPWDPDLRRALEKHAVAVYEEDLRAEMLTSFRS
jgi:hypothetical protein